MKKSKWLNKKILCGHCNFLCCRTPTCSIKLSDDEIKLYKEKYGHECRSIEYHNKHCQFLNEEEKCKLENDKPYFCKLYPIQYNNSNTLIIGNWAWLHCPKDTDYEFIHKENNKYYYRFVNKRKHSNKPDKIVMDKPIENFPNVFDMVNLYWTDVK
jgi:Fe-S-cluster containining protein